MATVRYADRYEDLAGVRARLAQDAEFACDTNVTGRVRLFIAAEDLGRRIVKVDKLQICP